MARIKSTLLANPADTEWKPIVKMRWFGGFVGVLRLLIDGHLKRAHCALPIMRLDGIQIDYAELQKVPRELLTDCHGYEDVDADIIDLAAARRRLKTTKSVVDAIINAEIVPHVVVENGHPWKAEHAFG